MINVPCVSERIKGGTCVCSNMVGCPSKSSGLWGSLPHREEEGEDNATEEKDGNLRGMKYFHDPKR